MHGDQRNGEAEAQLDFALVACASGRKPQQYLQGTTEMRDRFAVRRASDAKRASLPPKLDRALVQPRLRTMMREHFRLRLEKPRLFLLEYLRDARVQVLSLTLQQ